MLANVINMYTTTSLEDFVNKFAFHNKFGKAINDFIRDVKLTTGKDFLDAVKEGVFDSDNVEIERILEKSKGKFLLFYDSKEDIFLIYEIE